MQSSPCIVLPHGGEAESWELPQCVSPGKALPKALPRHREFIFKLPQCTENTQCLNLTCSQEEPWQEQNSP